MLRDRFGRYLPVTRNGRASDARARIPDEDWLNLLRHLEITNNSDVGHAREIYENACAGGEEPTFEQLIAAGWLRVVWGRVALPFEVDGRHRHTASTKHAALDVLLKRLFEERYGFDDALEGIDGLDALVDAIKRGDKAPNSVRGESLEWVAARLWDRTLVAEHAADLHRWIDRWRLTGGPSLVAHKVWSETAADAFCETALNTLAAESSLADWNEIRDRFITQICLRTEQASELAGRYVPQLPSSLLDRVFWLNERRRDGPVAGAVAANQDIASLIGLLLNDIEEQEFAAGPHALFKQLMDLVVLRPETLVVVLFRMQWSPVLLADLLLYPVTCALACWLIAQWPSQPGAYDRELRARDDKATQTIAFGDAIAVLGDFLERGLVPPGEVGALLAFLYRTAEPATGTGVASEGSMSGILLEEIAGQKAEIQEAVYEYLAVGGAKAGLRSMEFAAALDIVDRGGFAETIEPKWLVSAYVESINSDEHNLSARGITESAAATLAQLAMRTSENLRRDFLTPIDVKAKIAAARAPDVNPYSVEDTTARSLRAHIRTLCRAIAGLDEAQPKELASALIQTVRASALRHEEKWRLGAFAARFEATMFGRRERPIALDLAGALSALDGSDRDELVAAILEIDEPIVLAELIGHVRYETRTAIEARLDRLTPAESATIRSLPEARARINALLMAGRPDIAAKFIDDERQLRTFGKVPGRDLTQFRDDLHLRFLFKDWGGIAAAEPPADFTGQTRDAAVDLISFFKGLAALSDPDGSPEAAENFLGALHQRHQYTSAYAVNLFAARIRRLLGPGVDGFAKLRGSDVNRGRRILSDAEQTMLIVRDATAEDLETFNCNKAVLLLALGEPNRAYGVLESIPPGRRSDNVAAFSAVALDRLGRKRQAAAVLEQAIRVLGETPVLRRASEFIRSGEPFSASIDVSVGGDRIAKMKEALANLWQMDASEQAAVLAADELDPFVAFTVKQVRLAADAVVSALAVMKAEKPRFFEDDLSGLMHMPLAAGIRFLQWTVTQQEPGGYSIRGNAGKRDLAIKCNGSTLAVIEAVICEDPVTYQAVQNNLSNHFRRLLGYTTGRLFFHVVYSFVEKPSSVLDYLRQVAKEPPGGFKYLGVVKDFERSADTQPKGFIAEYEGPEGQLQVVFLALNMVQAAQRGAAMSAQPRPAAKAKAKKSSQPKKSRPEKPRRRR